MLKDRRGAVYAAGLGALAIFAVGTGGWLIDEANRLERSHQQQAQAKSEGYKHRARINAERRCLPMAPEAQNQCIREEAETARKGEHDEQDLQAQLVTSVWTRYMGIAAIIGMAVGIFGIGLIFVTFRATRRAARSAEQTYLAFIRVEDAALVVELQAGDAPKGSIGVYCIVSNIGRSAARVGICIINEDVTLPNETVKQGETRTLNHSPVNIPVGTSEFEGSVFYSTPLRDHRIVLSFKAQVHPKRRNHRLHTIEVTWSRTRFPEDHALGNGA